MHNAAQSYFQTQFNTMGQGEVLILLYDGALKFLGQAKEGIVAKDYSAKGICISKALDIINELDATLNKEEGGDLASNLHNLYFLCSTRLLQANIRMDASLIDSVIEILTGLRGAFAQIINKPEAQAASQKIVAKQKSLTSRSVQGPVAVTVAPAAGLGKSQASAAYAQASSAAVKTNEAPEETQAPVSTPAVQINPSLQPPVVSRSSSAAAYGRMANTL